MKKGKLFNAVVAVVFTLGFGLSFAAHSAISDASIADDKYVCHGTTTLCVSVEMANGAILDFYESPIMITLQ